MMMSAIYREGTNLSFLADGDKLSRDDCMIRNHSTSGSNVTSNESLCNDKSYRRRSNSLENPPFQSSLGDPGRLGTENRLSNAKSPPRRGGGQRVTVEEKEELRKCKLNNELELRNAFDSMLSVHEMYQHKIEWIEKNVPRGSVLSPNLKSKISLYQVWVEDLKEQNQVLMEIIRDLENENCKQVCLLKSKFSKVRKSFCKQDSVVKSLEKEVDRLTLVNKKLHDEKKKSSLMSTRLGQDRLKLAEEEIENLTTLLLRIRDECTWNMSGIQLSPEVQTQLFGQHPQLPGSRIGSSHAIPPHPVDSQSSFTFNEKCIELESAKEKLDNLRKKCDQDGKREVFGKLDCMEELKLNLREANIQLKYYRNTIEELKGKIRVYCRIRPTSTDYQTGPEKIVTKYLDPYTVGVETSKGVKEFQFDRIFGPNDCQRTVFDQTKSLIQSAFDGYNVCISAYGQTGSGKTHTILGENSDPGIAPLAFTELFAITNKMKSTYDTVISFYALELYRQKLIDLLSIDVDSTCNNNNWNELPDNNSSEKLEIRRDHTGTVFIQGARIIVVDNSESFEKYLRYVLSFRHTAETNVNERSSRSHFIMGIIIENTSKINGTCTRGKLSLVDLAGSERNGKFNGPPHLMEESKAINKSLSALEHVIVALTTDQPHVPYRNNKLTELMQDSIGGNAKTLIFVNISPTLSNSDETIVSLNYGSRVKQVVNSAVRNVDSTTTPRPKQNCGQPNTRSKPDISTPRSKTSFTSK